MERVARQFRNPPCVITVATSDGARRTFALFERHNEAKQVSCGIAQQTVKCRGRGGDVGAGAVLETVKLDEHLNGRLLDLPDDSPVRYGQAEMKASDSPLIEPRSAVQPGIASEYDSQSHRANTMKRKQSAPSICVLQPGAGAGTGCVGCCGCAAGGAVRRGGARPVH